MCSIYYCCCGCWQLLTYLVSSFIRWLLCSFRWLLAIIQACWWIPYFVFSLLTLIRCACRQLTFKDRYIHIMVGVFRYEKLLICLGMLLDPVFWLTYVSQPNKNFNLSKYIWATVRPLHCSVWRYLSAIRRSFSPTNMLRKECGKRIITVIWDPLGVV